jgi:hypothetical protein
MPYATGTANSATELRDAIVAAATANGWTWDSTNSMLYKGVIYGKLTVSGLNLLVQAALGYSGGTLNTPASKQVGITNRLGAAGNTLLSYPLTYHIFIHTAPDDIIVAVNYQVSWWQWLAIGQAVNLGVNGNCLWQWGTAPSDINTSSGVAIHVNGSIGSGVGYTSGAPFWQPNDAASVRNSSIYLDFNGYGWWSNPIGSSTANPDNARATFSVAPLLATQPNTWNGEAVLLRMHIMAAQPSGLWSHAAELSHLRMTRNDNLNDGQILTLGPERWFVAPVYRKNTASRDASTSSTANHSGTIAMAVRYDGP